MTISFYATILRGLGKTEATFSKKNVKSFVTFISIVSFLEIINQLLLQAQFCYTYRDFIFYRNRLDQEIEIIRRNEREEQERERRPVVDNAEPQFTEDKLVSMILIFVKEVEWEAVC